MKFKPLRDLILTRRLNPATQTESGLHIPQAAQVQEVNAVVVAVGLGRKLPDGTLVAPGVKPGDVVLLGIERGFPVEIDGVDHVIVYEKDLLAIIE